MHRTRDEERCPSLLDGQSHRYHEEEGGRAIAQKDGARTEDSQAYMTIAAMKIEAGSSDAEGLQCDRKCAPVWPPQDREWQPRGCNEEEEAECRVAALSIGRSEGGISA
mmetsp:Transcript_30551/g.79319  ORF Transcript_30551/g.79319 Transcript_30551/m.79319 type:complete len:109 (+) Transcript_30551:140-466(+)